MISRNSWTERHGAFFPPPLLVRQKPGGNQRGRLMMVPTFPRANLVLRQARFALGPPKTAAMKAAAVKKVLVEAAGDTDVEWAAKIDGLLFGLDT